MRSDSHENERKIAGIDLLEAADWNRLLEGSAVPFRFSHRADAAIAFEEAYPEYRRLLFVVDYQDGTRILFPSVLAQRRIRSLNTLLGMPLGWEGRPLALRGSVTATRVGAFFRIQRGIGEFCLNGGAGGSPPILGCSRELSTRILDLRPGFDKLWQKSFSKKNRHACRKAERSGVTVSRTEGPVAAQPYYHLYAQATRRWGYRTPPYPLELFVALGKSQHTEFWMAHRANELIAGAVLLAGSQDLFYWSGASARTTSGISPANLLLMQAIERGCQRGFHYMDFGASLGLAGVQKFKESFGTVVVPFHSVTLTTVRRRVCNRIVSLLLRQRQ